jgi:DNA-binding response OmpR family regulator
MGENDDTKRVLLVDDDSDFVRILELYLKLSGLDVSCAFCGMGALEELRITSPSAVILDLVMPDIDGVEVCRFIREKLGDKKMPVIVLTALSDTKARREILQAGADEFFTKPCDFELIFKAVEQHTS